MENKNTIDWEAIKKEYLESGGTVLLKDLATKYGVSDGTLRSRKMRDDWDYYLDIKEATRKRNVVKYLKGKFDTQKVKIGEKVIEHLEESQLTDKQKLFCIYYVKYFNGTKSAIKAGYSKATAHAIANNLLKDVRIRKEIRNIKHDRFIGAFLEPQDILQRYIDIAFADITDFMEFGKKEVVVGKGDTQKKFMVNYVDFKNSKEIDGTIVSEVKQGKDGVSIKLHDKMKALEFLANHIGLLSIEQQEKLRIEEEKFKLAERKTEILEEQNNKNIDDDISYEVVVDDEED